MKNTGTSTAFNLELQAPTSEDLLVLSFDKVDVTDLDYPFLDILPEESAMLVVLVTPSAEADIGYKQGTIVVRSQDIQSTLWVK